MSTRWSKEEKNLLAEVWIEVSQEQHTHIDPSFWNRVVDMFNNQTVGNNRNKNMVTGKWTRLNCECKTFNAIYNELRRTSRENDSDRLNNAETIF
jgi:aerobic-type carbon monoxide dehydrogenase small subunit (CoxS/CutS family)